MAYINFAQLSPKRIKAIPEQHQQTTVDSALGFRVTTYLQQPLTATATDLKRSAMSAAFAEKRFGLAGKKAVVTGLTFHAWHSLVRLALKQPWLLQVAPKALVLHVSLSWLLLVLR